MDCIMSVCGDEAYFKMAEYSIPSFLKNNIGSTLHVVTDKPERIRVCGDNQRIYKFSDCVNSCVQLQNPNPNEQFVNNGKMHKHDFVSLLPLMGNDIIDKKWICKIDCDSYFHGNLFQMIDKLVEDSERDLILADRTRTDIMKPYGQGLPGAGLLVWRKEGNFVKEYVRQFDGNEQSTVLKLFSNATVQSGLIMWPGAHWVYPFTWFERNGKKFTKEIADQFIPFYIHVGGSNQLEQLETLKEWYG
jgi:hypothetical protein